MCSKTADITAALCALDLDLLSWRRQPANMRAINGMKAEQMWVLQDVPPALKKNLKDGMNQIGSTCLKQNDEIAIPEDI